jgi:hypothetical protein
VLLTDTQTGEKYEEEEGGGVGEIEDWFKQKQSSGSRRWRRKKL